MNELDLFNKDYSERQFITFVDDKIYQDILKDEKNIFLNTYNEHKDNIKKVVNTVVSFLNPVAAIGFQFYKLLKKSEEEGIIITPVSKKDIKYFSLLPGHPRDKIVYVAHPIILKLYIPIVDFHRFVFEYKFSELIKILMFLGATEINVEHVKGWSKELGASLTIPIEEKNTTINGDVKFAKSKSDKLLFKANLKQ